MVKIGGNKTLTLQRRSVADNDIGEQVATWDAVQKLTGWLDMATGEAKYSAFNRKITESTHVFIADYTPIDTDVENLRAICDGQIYDVTYIDNPMELAYQLEIFLKSTGGKI